MSCEKVTLHGNVEIGEGCILEDGVIIGLGFEKQSDKTIIGRNSYIRTRTIIHSGVTIGDNFQCGPGVFIREDNKIGRDVCIWAYTVLNPHNEIGDGCRIHVGCFLEDVTLGKWVFVAPHVTFTNDPHPTNPPTRTCMKGAWVGDNAIIGGNVTILPHIRIGKKAIVGAGAVVTKDIKSGMVVVGNPARILKEAIEIACLRSGELHYPYK